MDLNNLMKELSQTLGKDFPHINDELAHLEAKGISGGGLIEITLNGKMMMTDITINPIVLEEKDTTLLGDLIKAAFVNASQNIQLQIQQEMKDKFNPHDLFQKNNN